MTTLYLLLLASVVGCTLAQEAPRVVVQQGQLEGRYETSASGRLYAAFRGVPYAAAPVGPRRFQAPDAATPWYGVRDATHNAPACLQYANKIRDVKIVGDEDCLHVNVFTPRLPAPGQRLLDVIFFIHGGAFMYGGNFMTHGTYLMDADVVLVTVNYRLGVLGFISAGDVELPGNNGLKDQSAALRWVHDNIAVFGGDPDSVTIAGLSAGGASVHYHYMAPMSRGLFHRGISLSGTALCQWALADALPEKTVQIADLLGCPSSPTRDLVNCLRAVPGEKLVGLTHHFQPWMYNPFSPWGPTVEPAHAGAFLTRHPSKAVKDGDVTPVPWLVGVTSDEGLYPAAEFVNEDSILSALDSQWDTISPHLLDFNYTVPLGKHQSVSQKIRNFYLEGKPVSRDTVKELIQMIGDRHFVVGIEQAARWQASSSNAPVYFYRFSYRGKHSFSDIMSNTTNNYGSCHGDDLAYVLLAPFRESNATVRDLAMCGLMQKIWTSFVVSGTPRAGYTDLEWLAVRPRSDLLNFLEIGVDGDVTVLASPDLGHRSFWESLPFYAKPARVFTDEL